MEKESTNAQKQNNDKKSFFKQVLISIKDFDKYNIFAEESVGQAFIYLLKIILIFTIVLTAVTSYTFSKVVNDVISSFDENITNVTYQDNELSVNDNQKVLLSNNEAILGKIEIDTSDLTDEQITEYKDELNNENNAIIFLKDEILIKNENLSSITEATYDTIFEKYDVDSFDKQAIIDYYTNNVSAIYTSIILTIFAYMFILYLTNVLIDALLLGVLGFITARISKLRITFTASFNIAIHSLTLSLILNMIYIVINVFTGFTIKYFQVMYTAIAYVYIITAIFMIKSDYIKRQTEVRRIESEEEKLKNEMQENEVERKRQEEKEKVKQKDKENENKGKDSSKKKDGDNTPEIGDKPEGSNV